MDNSFDVRVQQMLIQIVPFFMAIVIHEFGHGYVAKLWGDRTATDAGRLTLNPLVHVDPIGTIAIPVINMVTGIPFLFGWAKPVPINPSRFRKYRPGLFWVALAGPGSNILMAFLSAFFLCAFVKWAPETFSLYRPIAMMAMVGVQINFVLALFNLFPLPPLDGGRILESFLSYNGNQVLRKIERYSFFILLALLWSGAFSVIERPVNFMTHIAVGVAQGAFGINLL
jgi:Zn-dependent protease